ncbi:ABC transporter substrate-binding protein [Frankia sp. AgB1.9]|uniref:ABC transporter substrate-binding protein n=1 Tax=unclassified Frankia TaxID=2632575 RepID=UPI001932F695|nr:MULTISPECIES: ABC transporter substrate-binding protein [unclassified Frankia]MBL7492643.1 ABC transporter substrate-binding protein [Frankia sp. AgW1.1]MBL7549346.1 ABC transporter substrate-binding protein [Frankia sp. AgB1.9]MBL7619187.1 ABC transporter substrate-binding protein [Frankia sp. AgB1.8]
MAPRSNVKGSNPRARSTARLSLNLGGLRFRGRVVRRAALLTVLATALAAGCTASSDSAHGSVAGCDTPGFVGDTIRLGFAYPDSGIGAAALAAARSGFVARIEQANAAGGIHGRKLVYVWRDDASVSTQNLEVVRDLVENQKVFGLVEASISAAEGAVYLRDHGVPVTGIPAEAFWADPSYRNMFAYSYVVDEGPPVSTFGAFAKAQGGTRAAVIQNDVSPAANAIGAKLGASLAAAGIPTVPDRFVYNPTLTDPVQLGQQLRKAGVDVVTAAFDGEDLAEVVRGIRAAGAPVKVLLAPSGYDRSLLETYGPTLSGLTAAISYVPFELGGPAHQAFLRAMSSFAPEVQPPGQELALVTYILTDLFLYGLDKAGACPTRAQFIDRLRASTYDGGGLLPSPVDLSKGFGQLATCYTFMRVNAAGTGYDLVRDPTNRDQWCGHPLTQ